MAEGRARIREMRVDREIQLVRQADLPCDVTVEDEAVYLRIEATGRPVVVEISFPAAYPFMAPSVRVVDGKEVLGGKFVEGDPSLELASLQGWTPSTQAVELAREVIDAVVRLADAAAGREEGHHKTKTRRVAPAPEPEDEHAAPAPSRAAIAEPYYRPGEGVPFAALEQLMTFCAVHRVYTATEREELRYIGLSAESLTEVNPHPSKLNHVIVQFQRPLRSLQRVLIRKHGSQVELQFGRVEVVRSPGPAAQDAGHGHEDGVEEGLAADERHSGTRAAAGEGAATDPGTDAGTAARAGAGTGAGVGSAGPPEHRRVVLAAEVVTYSSPEARSVAGQIVQRMKGLGLQPAKKGGGEQQLDSAQPTAEELVRQRDAAMAEVGRVQGMMHRAPQSVLEVQRVSETYMRAAEALAALESGGEEGHDGIMRSLHAYLAREDVAAVLEGARGERAATRVSKEEGDAEGGATGETDADTDETRSAERSGAGV